MNKLELVDHIATEAELTKVAAAAALDAMLEGIEQDLEEGRGGASSRIRHLLGARARRRKGAQSGDR